MYIQIRLKNVGASKLYIQPKAEDTESKYFMLVDNSSNTQNPYFNLKLEDGTFKILTKRDEVEEDEDELKGKLSDLAMNVMEAQRQGFDLSEIDEEATKKSAKPYDPSEIRVEPKVFSLRQIYDMIGNGDLNISPDFQRNEVWDNFRKSRLIESILLRIPLPVFYFSEDEKGVLAVVDGLQRLSAIKQFMDNNLMLKDLEYLDNCEGKYFTKGELKLEDKYVRWVNGTQISANVIDSKSPYQVKFDIFRRINTGGKPLNAQELRNCLMNNAARETLRNMAMSKEFITATGNSITDIRMQGQEMAMRFIYFYNLYYPNHDGIKEYNGLIDDSLDGLVDKLRKLSKEQLSEYEEKYKAAMKNAYYLFGRHSFRKVNQETNNESGRSQINKALFVSLSVILSQYDFNEIKNKFEKNSFIFVLGKDIDTNPDLFYYLSYGTNGARNVIYTFKCMEDLITKSFKR